MAYASTTEGDHGTLATSTVIRVDPAHADHIDVPDAALLFTGQYHHSGPDLVITGSDGDRHVIPGYFADEKRPALVAPNGSSLSAELVELLAGSVAPGQYAQTQPTTPPDTIGRVEKVVGNVTVMRNGTAVALHVGDPVYKSDVVQTGADSSCGIGFPDGTALNLVANTRMALNDYVYDANGTSNDALFSLVQGGFAFVAGKVAHTGDMKINTPVATMGIRGTTGYAVQQVTANLGNVTMSFAVVADPGTSRVGTYVLIDQFGNEVAVDRAGEWTTLSWNGPNAPPSITKQAMTQSNFALEQVLIPPLVQILNSINSQQNPTPQQTTPGGNGSSSPPGGYNNPQQNIQQNNSTPFTINAPDNNSNGAVVTGFVTTASAESSSVVTWVASSSGTWNDAGNWNVNGVPSAGDTVQITKPLKVTVNGSETASSLVLGTGAVLNIVDGGSLTLTQQIANSGTLQLNSSGADPTLAIQGTVDLLNGGTINLLGPTAQNMIVGVAGTHATLVNVNNIIVGSGTIGSGDGELTLTNGSAGTIEAEPRGTGDSGVLIINTGNQIGNSGTMLAAGGGTLEAFDAVSNFGLIKANAASAAVLTGGIDNFGVVTASGAGAETSISGPSVLNESGALIIAAHNGTVVFGDETLTNAGTIEAVGEGSVIALEGTTVVGGLLASQKGGVIETTSGAGFISGLTIGGGSILETTARSPLHLQDTIKLAGTVTFEGDGTFVLDSGAAIVARSAGSAKLDNTGTIAGAGGIGGGNRHFTLVNEAGATINADDRGQTLDLNTGRNAIVNAGTLKAGSRATLEIDSNLSNSAGSIVIASLGTLLVSGATVTGGTLNNSGTIEFGEKGAGDGVNGSATLSGGSVVIDRNVTLTLDDVTVTNAATTNKGTIVIDTGNSVTFAGAGSLAGGTVNNAGTVAVTGTLAVSGVTFSGGTIADSGLIDVTGSVAVNGATLNGSGHVTVESGATLTLDDVTVSGTTITELGADSLIRIESGDTLTLEGGATLAGGAITNRGDIEIAGTASLYGDVLTNSGATLTIDRPGVLTLSGTTIDGGTVADAGSIVVSGAGTIENATVDGGGTITANATLTLDRVTIDDLTLSGSFANSSTLHVSGATTLSDASLNNGGTVDIGSGSTITGVTLTLDQASAIGGGRLLFGDSSDTLLVGASGASLDDVAVSGGGAIDVGSGTAVTGVTLTLDQGASVAGGTLVFGDSSDTLAIGASGAALDGVAVSGGGAIDVGNGSIITGVRLTLDQGSSIADGTLVFGDKSDSVVIGASGAALDGVAVSGGGSVRVGVGSAVTGVTLTLDQGTSIAGGGLLFGDDSDILLVGQAGAKLHGVAVSGGGAIDVGIGSTITTTTLTLDHGASVEGGTLVFGNDTDVVFIGTSGATLDGVAVSGGGAIDIGEGKTIGGAVLASDQAISISGVTLTLDQASSITGGTLVFGTSSDRITVGTGGATLTDLTVSGGGTVDAIGTLTLSGVTFDGVAASGTFANSGTLTIEGTTVLSAATITGGDVDDFGTILVRNGDIATMDVNTTTVETGAVIKATGAGSSLTIDENAPGSTNSGTIEAIDGATVTLNHVLTDNDGVYTAGTATTEAGGVIRAEGTGSILTINGLQGDTSYGTIEAVNGGTIDINTAINPDYVGGGGNFGTIEATTGGTVSFTGDALNERAGPDQTAGLIEASGAGSSINFSDGTLLNGGSITADSGGTLSFDNETVFNGNSIELTGAKMVIGGTVTFDAVVVPGDQPVTYAGSITLSGSTTNEIVSDGSDATLILGDNTISGAGTIGDAHLTLEVQSAGTINATGTEALVLDTGDNVITNAGKLEATGGGTLRIESGVDNTGTIEANGGTVMIAGSADISGTNQSVTITGGGVAEFAGSPDSTLYLNAAFTGGGTLQLDNSLHYGGTISGFGSGTVIDLADFAYLPGETDIWDSATGTLTLNNGLQSEVLYFSGTYNQYDFALASFGSGPHARTELIWSPVQESVSGLDGSGHAVEGSALTASLVPNVDGQTLDNITYEWVVSGHIVQSGSSDTFTPTGGEEGRTVDVVASYTIDGVAEQTTAVAGTVVAPPPPPINTWQGSPGAQWSENPNWSAGAVPGSGEQAVIASGGNPHIDSNVTLDNVALRNSGEIDVGVTSGAMLTLEDGATITGGGIGVLAIDSHGRLDIESAGGGGATLDGVIVTDNGAIDIGLTNSGATLTLDDGSTIIGGGTGTLTIFADNRLHIEADGQNSDPTLDGVLVTDRGSIVVGASTTDAVLTLSDGTTITGIDGGTLTINALNTVEVVPGSSGPSPVTTFTGLDVINNGTLEVNGGTLVVDATSTVGGTGSVEVTNGGLADFQGAFGQNVTFTGFGAGTLELAQSYGGTISGFGAGDALDLASLHYVPGCTTVGWADGVLTVQAGENTTLVNLDASPTDQFSVIQDGGTGTLVVFGNEWTNYCGDNNWSDSANWTFGAPDTTDAVIDLGGTYTIAFSGFTAANSLTIGDTGATLSGCGTLAIPAIDNNGTIEAAEGALKICGDVSGTGTLEIANCATLELDGTSTNAVTFETAAGTLIIDSSGGATYAVSGAGLTPTDIIDLPNIAFNAAYDSYNATTDVLTIGDGLGNTVNIKVVGGIGADDTFVFTQDSNGGTQVVDPPVTTASSSAAGTVLVAGAGNDSFVFHPGSGAETILNFNPKADSIDLDHFAGIQNLQQLASLVTTDPHGDAVIELGHGDSVPIPGVNAGHLQAHLQNVVHLH